MTPHFSPPSFMSHLPGCLVFLNCLGHVPVDSRNRTNRILMYTKGSEIMNFLPRMCPKMRDTSIYGQWISEIMINHPSWQTNDKPTCLWINTENDNTTNYLDPSGTETEPVNFASTFNPKIASYADTYYANSIPISPNSWNNTGSQLFHPSKVHRLLPHERTQHLFHLSSKP
jgi:hypothetical protein